MTCDFLAPTALHIGKAAGVIPYPILQMENNEVQEGALTHIKDESGSKREGCCLEELPSQKTKDPCRCPTLPPAPCLLPLEKGMPHTLLWARLCSTTIHPIPLTDIQTWEKWELGLNWLNTASPPGTQVRNDLDSGKNGRSILEKEDRKVLVPGKRVQAGHLWS